MNRASMTVTTVALLVLLVVFAPQLLRGHPAGGTTPVRSPASGTTSCPDPSFGPGATDAVVLCIAASHQRS